MTDNQEKPSKNFTMDRSSLSYWVIISTIMASSAIAIVVILCLLFFAPEMFSVTPKEPPEVKQRVASLSSEVEQLSNQVKDIEKKTETIKPGLIQNRLNSLEARLSDLSGSATKMQDVMKGLSDIKQGYEADDSIVETVTKMSSLVSNLNNRVETIQTENAEIKSNLSEFDAKDIKAANMLLVATQFQGAIDRNSSITSELNAIQALFNTDQEAMIAMKKLIPFANSGVPTTDQLSQELDELSEGILKAAIADDRDTVRNTLKSKLSQYVTIYQENADLPMGDTKSILRRARNSLDRGDVDQAILALSELKGPAATVIEPFFNQAEAHILAERLSKKISDQAIDFIRDASSNSSSNMPSKALY